ncbi:MAG TPA: hypothetical protein VGF14_05510 [Alphaproteobacteria bacterium]
MHKTINFLTLLTSSSTLLCCALPALLVTIGAGATLAGLVSNVPQLTLISDHKQSLFIFSAIMLTLAGILQYRQRHAPCPMDPHMAKACGKTRRVSLGIYFFSLTVYLTGFSFAYIIPRFM